MSYKKVIPGNKLKFNLGVWTMLKYSRLFLVILIFGAYKNSLCTKKKKENWHNLLVEDKPTTPAAKVCYYLEKMNINYEGEEKKFLIDLDDLSAESILVLLSNPQNSALKNRLEDIYLNKCSKIDRIKYKLFGTPEYEDNTGLIMAMVLKKKPQKSVPGFFERWADKHN